jgi:hypothetical protein
MTLQVFPAGWKTSSHFFKRKHLVWSVAELAVPAIQAVEVIQLEMRVSMFRIDWSYLYFTQAFHFGL